VLAAHTTQLLKWPIRIESGVLGLFPTPHSVLCIALMATPVKIDISSWTLAAAGVLFGFFVWRELSSRAQRRGRPLPPGPPGWPIIGNVLDIPSRDEHVKYAELSKKYGVYPIIDIAMDPDEHSGDVVYMDAGGQPMVILGSQRAAIELFERRGATYSSRPKSHMFNLCVRRGMWNVSHLNPRRQVRRWDVPCFHTIQ
jgi:hypothetical protein